MEITKEILDSERKDINDFLLSVYGKDSKEYRDMMFSVFYIKKSWKNY